MPKVSIRFLIVAISLAGCAHRGAVHVECDGSLRPVNTPAPLKDAPVTVVPGSAETSKNGGTAP